jgi:glucose/arabinose dehydrogenase
MSSRVRRGVPFVLLLAACGGGSDMSGGSSSPPPSPPPIVRIERAYPNLSFTDPVFVTAIPGTSHLAVVEQSGVIRSFVDSDSATSSSVLLDITALVSSGGETGLLGLAFDPDYATNGYIYVDYTAGGPLRTRISRFTVVGGVASQASEANLLEFAQPFSNHNGGMLAFGQDGKLYVASGDGGSANDPRANGQNLGVLLGKLLRLNPTPGAVVPNDNPFVGTPGARGEVWAYGLRNPWRFSVDRLTGEIWIADVGQGQIEEIDLGAAGANYGWRVYEGTRSNVNPTNIPPSAFTAPVFEYDHSVGQSITGGYRYRGAAIPALAGKYVYGDFVAGRIWMLTLGGNAALSNLPLGTLDNPSSFGETASGELLIVSYGGTLHRIVANL